MACLFALLVLASPRLALIFLWLFTDLVQRAFHHTFLPALLGLVFLPWTTLMYVLVWTPTPGVSGIGWFWVILGLIIDLSSYGSSSYANRSRLGYA
jgi:hypothetical protein